MLEDMQLRGLSARTQEAYARAAWQLAQHYHRSPDQLSDEDLRQYFLYLANEKKIARPTATIALCRKQLEQARTLLSTSTTTNAVDSAPDTPPTEQALQSTPARCPLCGIGQLLLVEVLPPQRKVPP
jgi:uncharacterized phage protein gp47/JayE